MAALDVTDDPSNQRIIYPSEFWEEIESNQKLEFSPPRHHPPTEPPNVTGSVSEAVVTSPEEKSLLENLLENQLQLSEEDISNLLGLPALSANEAPLPTGNKHLLLNTSDQYNHEGAEGALVGGQFHFDQKPCRTTGWADQQASVTATSTAQSQQSSGPAASVQAQSRAPARPRAVAPQVRPNTAMSKTSGVADNSGLPDVDVFRLKVMFEKTQVAKTENERDCFLYYQSPDHDSVTTTPPTATKVPIVTSHFQDDERSKEKRLTLKVLENCVEGVRIYSDCNGNIFVQRLCKSHVYWSDAETKQQEAKKLEHDRVRKVFDYVEFEAHIKSRWRQLRQNDIILPAVWLSFAQKHGGASGPVNRCLVWARIEPLRARMMVEGVNVDVQNTSLSESLSSANIQDGTSI